MDPVYATLTDFERCHKRDCFRASFVSILPINLVVCGQFKSESKVDHDCL